MHVFHMFSALFLAAIWGFNFIFIQFALQDMSPLMLCALRFFFASVPALLFFRLPKTSIKLLVAYGLLIFALQFLFLFLGIKAGVTPGLAGLLVQVQVFFSLFFASLILKERILGWQIIGALVAFSGVAVVFMHVGGEVSALGLVLILCASLSWGLGSLLIKKMGQVDPMGLVVWGSFIAFIPLCVLVLCMEGLDTFYELRHISSEGLISVLYIAYASTWVGYGLWNSLLGRYAISMLVPFTFLVPIFAIIGSVLILHEPLYSWKILAGMLVLSGLCINLFSSRLPTKLKLQDQVNPLEKP